MWLTGSRPWPASWDSIVLYNPSLGKIQNSHYAFYRMCIGVAPSKNQKIVSHGAFMFNKLHSTEHSIIHRLCIEWFCPAVASVNLSLLKVDRAKLCCLAAVIYFLRHVWLFCDPVHCSLPAFSVHGISQARILSRLPFPSPEDLPNSETIHVSCIAGRLFTTEPPGKPMLFAWLGVLNVFSTYDVLNWHKFISMMKICTGLNCKLLIYFCPPYSCGQRENDYYFIFCLWSHTVLKICMAIQK